MKVTLEATWNNNKVETREHTSQTWEIPTKKWKRWDKNDFSEGDILKGKRLSVTYLLVCPKEEKKLEQHQKKKIFGGIIRENLPDKKERLYVQVKRPHCLLGKKKLFRKNR